MVDDTHARAGRRAAADVLGYEMEDARVDAANRWKPNAFPPLDPAICRKIRDLDRGGVRDALVPGCVPRALHLLWPTIGVAHLPAVDQCMTKLEPLSCVLG
jgi:hypothetical protein